MSPLFSSVELLLPPGSSEEETPQLVVHSEFGKENSTPKKSKKRRKSKKSSSEEDLSSTTLSMQEKLSEEEEPSNFNVENQTSLQAESQARYFSESNVICSNCGLVGHLSVLCPEEVIGRRCFLCGGEGHLARNCPEELCHNCLRPGHKRKDCDLPKRDWKRHEKHSYLNHDDIRNVKKLNCYVCGKIGHLDCSFERMKFCRIVSCYNCGQRGHSAGSCRRPNADEYMSVANKLVKTYSRSSRKRKQHNMKDEAAFFTEQVEQVLKERNSTRRMSAPYFLESRHSKNNKVMKQRRRSGIS